MYFRGALTVAAVAAVLAVSPAAPAHSAKNAEKGRMAIRNDAGVGLDLSLPLQADRAVVFVMGIRPVLDVFVIDNLSIGGTLDFALRPRAEGVPEAVGLSVSPRIGYSIPVHRYISFWPQFAVGVGFVHQGDIDAGPVPIDSHTDAILPLQLFLPFYVHPAESFFLGMGPGVYVQPLAPGFVTIDVVRFSIGGSFPVF